MKIKKGGNVSRMLEGIPIPDMFRAEQAFDKSHIEPTEIPSIVRKELSRPEIADTIRPGMSIAITAGSRGVANVDTITRAIVDFCKERGADPFIVPAMGSHGGATAEGQAQLLEGYGITAETMGCPVRSSMETVLLDILSSASLSIRTKMLMRPMESSSPAASSLIMRSAGRTRVAFAK